jgi:subtilisin family serine protease
LLAVLLLVSGQVGELPAAEAGGSLPGGNTPRVAIDLQARVQQEGSLPVVVRLDLSFVPEGRLPSAASALAQRDRIRRLQDNVLAGLPAGLQRAARRFRHIPYLALEVDSGALADLLADPDVLRVQEDVPSPPDLAQSIPWIGADDAWSTGYTGAGQTVVILDTGVDSSHPFLAGKDVDEACFSGAYPSESTSLCPNNQPTQFGGGSGEECLLTLPGCTHGTHVAGIAVGRGATFSGVAKDATYISIQVFSRFDTDLRCGPGNSPCILSWTADQMAALDYVHSTLRLARPIAAANLSLGGGRFTAPCDLLDARTAVIDNLRSVGIATVIAAGNSGYRDALASPACISSAVSVGSTTDSDGVSSFSNVASFLSLFAPGDTIQSSVPGGGFQTWGGTSMAAPHVSGAWAVLRSRSPAASVSEILGALTGTGVLVTDTRSGGSVVRPRLQVDAAAVSLPLPATPTPTATVTPTMTPTATPTPTATATPTATVAPPTLTASLTATSGPSPTVDPGGLLGDLSQDGLVDVLDLQLCVNVVLGTETTPAIVDRADLNADDGVDVLDIQAIVNLILGT